jgi:hypothetical protein
MKNTLYIAFAILVSIASCTTDATNVEVPNTAPKISVTCFISDDIDTINANIFWSDPVFTNSDRPEFPSDMDVRISNGTTEGVFTYNETNGRYQLPVTSFPLVAGQTYSLVVKATDGTTVTASTYIPFTPPIVASATATISEQSQGEGFKGGNFLITFKTTLQNASEAFEYYRFSHYLNFQDPVNEYDYTAFYGSTYFNDDALSNNALYSEFNVQYFDYGMDQGQISCITYIMNATEEYYRFHQTLENQSPGDPFSEPTLVYSNVENGLGVFAGYKKVRVEVLPQ